MERISQSLVSKITKLQKRLESFLDNDFEAQVEEREKTDHPFEPSRELSLVRGLAVGLPDDHIDRAIVAFSRLAMLFDVGVLLENNDSQWTAQAYFTQGHTQLLKGDAKTQLRIPPMTMLSVLKTDAGTMFEKLKLQHLDDGKTTCLLIKTSPDFAYILFSTLPDIWLKDHIESVRAALLNGFAEA